MNVSVEWHPMRRLYAALFLLSLTSLAVEMLLTRVFDVILWPNLSFLIISGAIFGLGVGGLYEILRRTTAVPAPPSRPALGFALTVWSVPALLNVLPFSVDRINVDPLAQVLWFLLLYLVLLAPFVFVGVCVCRIFSANACDISRLYFWDLGGAAIGAGAVAIVIEPLGPERLFAAASLVALAAVWLLAPTPRGRALALALGMLFALAPSMLGQHYLPLTLHDDKRGTERETALGRLEFSAWDPVSQIAVLDEPSSTSSPADHGRKHIAYDGGTQTSNFFPFDGNFADLRAHLAERLMFQFWQRGVLAAHYARRDSGARVLIIGSAGGQETKAALLYGARDVDAVEMVGTVVRLATGRYAAYIGHLFDRPNVHVQVGEGRTFLRASTKRYDIIQIFSNYTSSSVAEGSGAFAPAYLLTREAFDDYFAHLSPDGILQINHMYYPRLITTAAEAWPRVAADDFRTHVLVFEKRPPAPDYLPTVLIKRSPWTRADVDDLSRFFAFSAPGESPYWISEDPIHPERSFLPRSFYLPRLTSDLVAAAPYNIQPATDDQPFLKLARRSLRLVAADRTTGTDRSTAWALNTQLFAGWLPREWMHLIGGAVASVFYGLLLVVVPLLRSAVGRERWHGKLPALSYFSLLGFAFITVELVLIQLWMKVIGFPLYTVATVLTVVLVGAALGSMMSPRLMQRRGSSVAFVGIVAAGLFLISTISIISRVALTEPIAIRIAVAAAATAPLAFFMGMPFPMGIAELSAKPHGAVAWAWSLNGLCTTAGAVLCAWLSVWMGLRATLLIALGSYVGAGVLFARLRRSNATTVAIDADVMTNVA
jgi:hypothetical protein